MCCRLVNDNVLCVSGTHSLYRPFHTAHLLSARNKRTTKKQREVIDLPLFAILRGTALSRQTGTRKFPTEVSATKHAHAAHAHVHHHHVVAQLLHGCFLPFLKNRLCFDVGILAPYRAFVKHLFDVLCVFTNLFSSPTHHLCHFTIF